MSSVNGIAAVVLNYKTWQDCVNCVNDLKAQSYADKHIVVVENGSGNESAEELNKLFDNDPLVTVLISDTNLGFAGGNNLGIRYAHEKLGYDTLFVVNSDVRLHSKLFEEVAALNCAGVGAVSPAANCRDGSPQVLSVNCDDIDKQARSTVVNLIKANIVALPCVEKLYAKKKNKKHISDEPFEPKKYLLCGCAYFLTPEFFRHYPCIYPKTFLYWEEVDLLLMLKRAGLTTLYLDTEPIVHMGGVSTGTFAPKSMSRFRLKQSNRSMRKSMPLILGMGEERIVKCIQKHYKNAPELNNIIS